MNILNWFKRPSKERKKLMQHFSAEYRDQLINEHKLVSATIAHLRTGGIAHQKARAHGQDAYALALNNLSAKKVELEGMIDVLSEFLD